MNQNSKKIGLLIVIAMLLEIAGIVLLLSPHSGSLFALPLGSAVQIVVVFIVALALPWIIRWSGGPRPYKILLRDNRKKSGHSIYLGILVGLVLASLNIIVVFVYYLGGVSFGYLLPDGILWGGLDSTIASLLIAIVIGYVYFGYIQGFVSEMLGERSGAIIGVLLYVFARILPIFAGYGYTDIIFWMNLMILYTPEAIALSLVTAKTRSVVAPIVALLCVSLIINAVGRLNSLFGDFAVYGAVAVLLLVGGEVLIGERQKVNRFIKFGSGIFSKGEKGSLLDLFFIVLAIFGIVFAIIKLHALLDLWYVYVSISFLLIISAVALWIASGFRKRRGETSTSDNANIVESGSSD